MEYVYTLAVANYNCENTNYDAYGEGNYGTCSAATSGTSPPNNSSSTSTAPGAPNTGFLSGMVHTGAFSIILPMAVAIIIVVVATIVTNKKRTTHK